MNARQLSIIEAAKAYASLVGGIATALAVQFTSGPVEKVLTCVAIVCTAIVVWVVPNGGSSKRLPADEYPDGYAAAVEADDETP